MPQTAVTIEELDAVLNAAKHQATIAPRLPGELSSEELIRRVLNDASATLEETELATRLHHALEELDALALSV